MGWQPDAACADDARFTDQMPPGRAGAARRAQLLAVCGGCPVLDDCRRWAAGFDWFGVVVAGWQAPRRVGVRPPWAGERDGAVA